MNDSTPELRGRDTSVLPKSLFRRVATAAVPVSPLIADTGAGLAPPDEPRSGISRLAESQPKSPVATAPMVAINVRQSSFAITPRRFIEQTAEFSTSVLARPRAEKPRTDALDLVERLAVDGGIGPISPGEFVTAIDIVEVGFEDEPPPVARSAGMAAEQITGTGASSSLSKGEMANKAVPVKRQSLFQRSSSSGASPRINTRSLARQLRNFADARQERVRNDAIGGALPTGHGGFQLPKPTEFVPKPASPAGRLG